MGKWARQGEAECVSEAGDTDDRVEGIPPSQRKPGASSTKYTQSVSRF